MSCVLSDLSGALWEALLFDTPVGLAVRSRKHRVPWEGDAPKPTHEEFTSVVPLVTTKTLAHKLRELCKGRRPQQKQLAMARLGTVDGKNSQRIIRDLIARGFY